MVMGPEPGCSIAQFAKLDFLSEVPEVRGETQSCTQQSAGFMNAGHIDPTKQCSGRRRP